MKPWKLIFNELVPEEKARSIGIRELIMKPIVINEIAITIRRVLDLGSEG